MKEPIKVLRFLAQIKRACNSNGALKGMAHWIIPNFMKDGSELSLKVRMNP